MPRLHEREQVVAKAEISLAERLSDWGDEHDLTSAEFMQVIMSVMSNRIASVLKYQIRYERHGDYETPGGWAKD